MVVRRLIVAVGIAAALVSCGANGNDAGSAALPTPNNADDEQIRKVLYALVDAGWDATKSAELTCEKFRRNEAPYADLVPPIDTFPRADVQAVGPDGFARQLAAQFPGITPESARAVADAVVRNDEPAYEAAMTDVMKKSTRINLDEVDDIRVNGDNATADVTVTFTVGAQPPRTRTTEAHVVRENGQWKDCTAPESG